MLLSKDLAFYTRLLLTFNVSFLQGAITDMPCVL